MTADTPAGTQADKPPAPGGTTADPLPPAKDERRRGDRAASLSSLVGAGSSRVGTDGAMRARDVSRPR